MRCRSRAANYESQGGVEGQRVGLFSARIAVDKSLIIGIVSEGATHTTAMSSDDDIYFSKALAEYRADSGDDREFVDLEAEVQHEILKRAQGLKAQREREKRG